MKEFGKLTGAIISAAIEVHRVLGPGLVETIYETCLIQELLLRGYTCVRQMPMAVTYKGVTLSKIFIIDLVVEGSVIVELKSAQANHPVHAAQLLTYLKLADLREGLVLNFGLATLKEGIQRVVNDY